jgi:aerobic-type carbon monoxide dehydrogenase small subunit (CoxS/CutS family)
VTRLALLRLLSIDVGVTGEKEACNLGNNVSCRSVSVVVEALLAAVLDVDPCTPSTVTATDGARARAFATRVLAEVCCGSSPQSALYRIATAAAAVNILDNVSMLTMPVFERFTSWIAAHVSLLDMRRPLANWIRTPSQVELKIENPERRLLLGLLALFGAHTSDASSPQSEPLPRRLRALLRIVRGKSYLTPSGFCVLGGAAKQNSAAAVLRAEICAALESRISAEQLTKIVARATSTEVTQMKKFVDTYPSPTAQQVQARSAGNVCGEAEAVDILVYNLLYSGREGRERTVSVIEKYLSSLLMVVHHDPVLEAAAVRAVISAWWGSPGRIEHAVASLVLLGVVRPASAVESVLRAVGTKFAFSNRNFLHVNVGRTTDCEASPAESVEQSLTPHSSASEDVFLEQIVLSRQCPVGVMDLLRPYFWHLAEDVLSSHSSGLCSAC